MKHALLAITFALAFFSPIFAQVTYLNVGFNEALSKATVQRKLVFLQLEPGNCRQCIEVAAKGLSDAALSKTINESFVPLLIGSRHPDRREIEKRFNLSDETFGSFFIDPSGTLIHRFNGTTTQSETYKREIDVALFKAGEALRVSQLEEEYRKGNKSPGFLESLLLKKNELGLDKTDLLDEYVALLPADSLASLTSLRFVASMAPVIGTKAHQLLRQNSQLFNQAWYGLPLNKRIAINNRIIHYSLNKAVREADEPYATQVAAFARGTMTNGRFAAEKAYVSQLLEFYDRTDNREKYLSTAVLFYNTYLMTVDVDSVKRLDEARKEKMVMTSPGDTVRNANGFSVRSTISFSPVAQRYTWELKEGARNVYRRTSDEALLATATTWAKRALAFFETYEAYDVYARLLYKQGRQKEAIEAEKKSIEIKKRQGYPVADDQVLLAAMEKGDPVGD